MRTFFASVGLILTSIAFALAKKYFDMDMQNLYNGAILYGIYFIMINQSFDKD